MTVLLLIFLLLNLVATAQNIPAQNIVVDMQASLDKVQAGDFLVYTIYLKNQTNTTIEASATWSFTPPFILSYPQPPTKTFNFKLLPHTSSIYQISTKVKIPLPINISTITHACLYIDNVEVAQVPVELKSPKLFTSFEVYPKGTVAPSAEIIYKINYSNQSDISIPDAEFLIILDKKLYPLEYAGKYYPSNNTILYKIGNIPAWAETRTISLRSHLPSTQINESLVQSICKFSSYNIALFGVGTLSNIIAAMPDFSQSEILPDVEYIKPGEDISFGIRLKNTGNTPSKFVNIEIKDIKGLTDIRVGNYLQSLAEIIPDKDILNIKDGFHQLKRLKPGFITIRLNKSSYTSRRIPNGYSNISELLNEINTALEGFYIKYLPKIDKFNIELEDGVEIYSLEEDSEYGFFSCINLPCYNPNKNIIRYTIEDLEVGGEEYLVFSGLTKDEDNYSFEVSISDTLLFATATFKYKSKIDRLPPGTVDYILETKDNRDIDFDTEGYYKVKFQAAIDRDAIGINKYELLQRRIDIFTGEEKEEIISILAGDMPPVCDIKSDKGYIYYYRVFAYDFVGRSSEGVYSDGIAVVDFYSKVDKDKKAAIRFGGVELDIEKGSFDKPVDIAITKHNPDELSPIYKNKLNLVAEEFKKTAFIIKAYLHYEKEHINFLEQSPRNFIKITLPYYDDKKEEYLRIYVWLDQKQRFEPIIYQEVDKERKTITGYTDKLGYFVIGLPKLAKQVKVYPNPFYLEKGHQYIRFDGIGQGAEIFIYNIAANLVKHEKDCSGSFDWKVVEEDIASGVYLYFIKSKDFEKEGKILIIK